MRFLDSLYSIWNFNVEIILFPQVFKLYIKGQIYILKIIILKIIYIDFVVKLNKV